MATPRKIPRSPPFLDGPSWDEAKHVVICQTPGYVEMRAGEAVRAWLNDCRTFEVETTLRKLADSTEYAQHPGEAK